MDIIRGPLHYPQNLPTSTLIYQGHKSKIQIKIWEWCCIRSYLSYTENFLEKVEKREKGDFRRGTVAILVLAASYLNESIKNSHLHHCHFTSYINKAFLSLYILCYSCELSFKRPAQLILFKKWSMCSDLVPLADSISSKVNFEANF